MIISHGGLFPDFDEYSMYLGSPEGKHFKNVWNLSHFNTQTVFLSRVKSMLNNSQTDRNKSAQYKVKS